jgi:hypothetical protein
MQVKQINVVHPQAVQAPFRRFFHVRRVSANAQIFCESELSGQEDVGAFSSAFEPFTDDIFRVAIYVRTDTEVRVRREQWRSVERTCPSAYSQARRHGREAGAYIHSLSIQK